MIDYAVLHEPYAALLQAALLEASPAGASVALDLAAGDGHKTVWLAAHGRPGGLVVALDQDRPKIAVCNRSGVT
ncbi:MAG: hypothetical protein EOM24_31135, partial [Chloroflexia bacterium]|nr:hypothetical protein [Chloroflexia bacterium]